MTEENLLGLINLGSEQVLKALFSEIGACWLRHICMCLYIVAVSMSGKQIRCIPYINNSWSAQFKVIYDLLLVDESTHWLIFWNQTELPTNPKYFNTSPWASWSSNLCTPENKHLALPQYCIVDWCDWQQFIYLCGCCISKTRWICTVLSLDRAVQRSIEPQKLQKGALLYSSAQYPAKSVQLCVGLSLSVGLCTEWPKMETWFFFSFGLPLCCYCIQLHCEKRVNRGINM